jgi:hypothetical protein
MEKKRIHIIKRFNRWAVKKEGNLRASRLFDVKKDAENSVLEMRRKGYDIIIHEKDGTVQKWVKAYA